MNENKNIIDLVVDLQNVNAKIEKLKNEPDYITTLPIYAEISAKVDARKAERKKALENVINNLF